MALLCSAARGVAAVTAASPGPQPQLLAVSGSIIAMSRMGGNSRKKVQAELGGNKSLSLSDAPARSDAPPLVRLTHGSAR